MQYAIAQSTPDLGRRGTNASLRRRVQERELIVRTHDKDLIVHCINHILEDISQMRPPAQLSAGLHSHLRAPNFGLL